MNSQGMTNIGNDSCTKMHGCQNVSGDNNNWAVLKSSCTNPDFQLEPISKDTPGLKAQHAKEIAVVLTYLVTLPLDRNPASKSMLAKISQTMYRLVWKVA